MEEKVRRPKYALTLAHSSQLLLGELAYDIAGMQYKLEVSPLAMPNVGLARSYLCAAVAAPSMDLLAGTMAGELVVFSTEAQVYRDALPVSRNGVHSLAACRSTGFVYVGAGDGVLKKLVGRSAEWSLIGQVQLVGGITSISVAPGGAQLFAGTTAGKTYVVNTSTLEVLELASSHLGAVTACAFDDSSETVATISVDGSVRLWDLSTYSLRAMATETVAGLSITQTKMSTMLTGWADGWIRAFDAQSVQKKWHIANAHRGEVTSVASSADGKFAVSGASDGGVSVWSLATRELVLQFHEHSRAVSEVLADVRRPNIVHSCGLDKALFIYDLKSERRVMAQQVREGSFHGIAQRLDSENEIVTAGADGRLLVWDCDVQDPVMALTDPRRPRFTCVSVSPSGRFLAAGGDDNELRVYDVARLSLLASSAAMGHSATVNKLAWSPDERQLVSVGADACVCVWNFYVDER
jgi:WD40 repeat protein